MKIIKINVYNYKCKFISRFHYDILSFILLTNERKTEKEMRFKSSTLFLLIAPNIYSVNLLIDIPPLRTFAIFNINKKKNHFNVIMSNNKCYQKFLSYYLILKIYVKISS